MFSAGCSMDESCGRSLCGCAETIEYEYNATFVNEDGIPQQGLVLYCPEQSRRLDTSNALGQVAVRFETINTPGCGILTCGQLEVLLGQRVIAEIKLIGSSADQQIIVVDILTDENGDRPLSLP